VHSLSIAVYSALALGWLIQGARAYRGMRGLPHIGRVAPLEGTDVPRVSILFAARDEAEKLPAALESMLALNYPNLEIVAVDDRSRDSTGAILDDSACRDPRLRVVHIADLPPGWLGKPHALEAAYEHSSGDWLVFTDADVHFSPDVLRRAMALAAERSCDHLTLLASVVMHGFWETTALSFFGFAFVFGSEPWRVSDPHAPLCYVGVGAFQILRRTTYQAIGTHRRLALEVVDDMKLAKLVKLSGRVSCAGAADGLIRVRWQDGFNNVVRGVTKNMFASFGFSAPFALFATAAILLISFVPFAGLLFASGAARAAAGVAALAAVLLEASLAHEAGVSRLYGLTHPLGALIFAWMVLRSMIVTLWYGGIVWRDTFYPLDELRRGMV
jgi:glycosyltransferase involved in cell wall biosynthesis